MQSPQANIFASSVCPYLSTEIPLSQFNPDSSANSTLGITPAPITNISASIDEPPEQLTRSTASSPSTFSKLSLRINSTPFFKCSFS